MIRQWENQYELRGELLRYQAKLNGLAPIEFWKQATKTPAHYYISESAGFYELSKRFFKIQPIFYASPGRPAIR